MRLVWMIEAYDDVMFFSEAFFDRSDKVPDIVSCVEDIHRIPLVDEYDRFLFILIDSDISDMIFHDFFCILIPYFLQKELDIFIHV